MSPQHARCSAPSAEAPVSGQNRTSENPRFLGWGEGGGACPAARRWLLRRVLAARARRVRDEGHADAEAEERVLEAARLADPPFEPGRDRLLPLPKTKGVGEAATTRKPSALIPRTRGCISFHLASVRLFSA